ncbi:alpha/beta fold hydrolase [Streptomyces sp. NPDC059152]
MDGESVARDMDAIRAALGESKISFIGHSYGTFLGERYARLFPDRLRALAPSA